MEINEILTYLIYIYTLIYLFIYIKPTPLIMSMFYIYIYISTFYISIGCNNNILQQDIVKYLIIGVYSLICIGFFYFINVSWKYYKKNILYKFFLFILPFAYYINIKVSENIWKCNENHTINKAYPIYFIIILINILLLIFFVKK
jgi:hypothetical protein